MSTALPQIYAVRHGDTAWSVSGQHTGRTDLPLNADGEKNARRLAERLGGRAFARVFTSPLQRASRTCELAGYGAAAQRDDDLVEWDYGDYEGIKTADIHKTRPGWKLFRDGCPNGESLSDVAARADRVIGRVRAVPGDVLLFSSGHFLRTLAARWLGLDPSAGQYFLLGTSAISILSYEHDLTEPAIRRWNDTESR